MSSSPYRRNLFDVQIAGPRSGRAYNGLFPGLSAVNDASEVLGPGRLGTAKETLITLTWPPNGSQGQVEIEGSDDDKFTGVWANLGSFIWSAANKKDQWRYTGGMAFVRLRCSVIVDGTGGATATASGKA